MLAAKVASITGLDRLVIVGSQSAHGQLGWLPAPVIRSVEADFLLPGFGRLSVIDDECGPESDFYAKHGVYADPLGAGIVTLPRGWEERLVQIVNEEGKTSWLALEIHDTAASKLMAGRDKDYDFITELSHSDKFNFDTFLARAALLRESSHAAGLRPRVQKLADHLAAIKMHDAQRKTLAFLKTLPV
ncbi:MAG: hypothetical protein IPK22_16405 [Verrucomicrobiaceae bacterium]|nr:hypothetical protein [Verrucomicrobiaceae bacterium]